jgi:ferritin-like metal-binding protein YciE
MPSQTAREVFVVGLRNAHAIESQALELMERQSERMTDFPQVQEKARAHAEETRAQMRRLEECLNALGEDRSVLKDTAMSLLGNMAAMGHAVAGDEILKNTFANYAFEHYEIASYKSLLTIARDAGFSNAAVMLQTSLEEEERMAAWIGSNIEQITRMYLSREERRAA